MTELFTLRPATPDDMDVLVEMIRQSDTEDFGTSNFDRSEIEYIYTMPKFDPARDIRLAVDSLTGQPVGFVFVFTTRAVPVRPWGWGWTHPSYRGRGIGSAFVQWMLERAKLSEALVPPEARIVMEIGASEKITSIPPLLTAHGFTTQRALYTMRIDLDGAPEVPALPDGLRFVTYAERPDLELFARARKAGFADHRGAVDEPLEASIERTRQDIEADDFDPELWILAMDGDQPAGLAFNSMKDNEYPDAGYVASLAVLPDYRKRGLGLTLLKKSFAELHARGHHSVVLGVDGSSLTGAVRLYERAGMHVHHRTLVYEREIRPGVELSKQN
ncbi:MAG: GNAT family N-acetyltransferase [Anaerolineae bacterium]|nr:GNAT family N-acetyltransferase [Anaerolineae bacterium]